MKPQKTDIYISRRRRRGNAPDAYQVRPYNYQVYPTNMNFQPNDGGRSKAGFKGSTSDCVCRALAIAMDRPYREVYDELFKLMGKSPRLGVVTKSKKFKEYMRGQGWEWVPTMKIGSGCKVHLLAGEIPWEGTYICSLSKHYTTVIDSVIHDTYDPSRGGTRCVYGYWQKQQL